MNIEHQILQDECFQYEILRHSNKLFKGVRTQKQILTQFDALLVRARSIKWGAKKKGVTDRNIYNF